ncbi:MAG: DsrE/DsrF/DrsH-like family protein [Chloroflexi bacterium]|nr:DsrE/DsrF/DrsH-like family protein [Chloroflexota bacterium]
MTDEKKPKRVAIVASKGSLDMAYPPLILATTAASMGWEVGIFFTFFGLDIVNKKKYASLKVAPLGNPAMPVSIPNVIAALPGMTGMATWMMRRMMRKQNVPTVPELLDMCRHFGVHLFGCSTTMGVMGVADEDMIEGTECAGAAAFLEFASGAEVSLFV